MYVCMYVLADLQFGTNVHSICEAQTLWTRPTARFTLRCYTRTIPIYDKETFLPTGFHELIT